MQKFLKSVSDKKEGRAFHTLPHYFMPYRKEQFANGEIYHIILKIISDGLLFQDESDFFRMIFSIYEFNNSNPVDIFARRKERARFKKSAEGRAFH